MPGQGRKRKTSVSEDLKIFETAMEHPYKAIQNVRAIVPTFTAGELCDRTVRMRLREVHVRCCRPVKGVVLTERHRRERLLFANSHIRWSRARWSKCLFTDESRFNLFWNDGRLRVYRGPGTRFQPENIVQYDRYGGGSVMIWGGIGEDGRTDIVVVDGTMRKEQYRDRILAPHVVPYAGAVGDEFTLIHDNARPHVAGICTHFLEEQGVEVLRWPANSPDLNPIEHLWDEMGRRLRQPMYRPSTVNELTESLCAIWYEIKQDTINRLIRSMHRRCMAVKRAGGGHTRY